MTKPKRKHYSPHGHPCSSAAATSALAAACGEMLVKGESIHLPPSFLHLVLTPTLSSLTVPLCQDVRRSSSGPQLCWCVCLGVWLTRETRKLARALFLDCAWCCKASFHRSGV